MKILFLCGCLEPSKDGVGDYTRRLAGEIINLGHSVRIIALNDKFSKDIVSESQSNLNVEIKVLRLPQSSTWKIRFNLTQSQIASFKPDWISVQFVPYSFQNKGLPYFLPQFLSNLSMGIKWHIMFHELSVGLNIGADFKSKLYGQFQLYIIKAILKKVKPHFISTNTEIYSSILAKIFKGDIIYSPVFSNISTHVKKSKKELSKQLKIVVFGNIFPFSQLDIFFEEIKLHSVHFVFLGGQNLEKNKWIANCLKHEIEFTDLGECPSDEISKILNTCNFGLSTTPKVLLDKSGTTAAFLEHHLPVINLPMNWDVKDFSSKNLNPNIYTYKLGDLQTILKAEFFETTIHNANNTAINLMNKGYGKY